ncbi:MAG: dipeptide epimerase [Dictyoglomus sp. NZ13-RE01]|nr:MAG: dipeptide epimerase [Dictyoglomus sp. NZ13-RE01]
MEIVDVKLTPKKYRLKEVFKIATGERSEILNLEIEIFLKDGTIGVGEASSSLISKIISENSYVVLEKSIKDLLIGENILKLRYLWKKLKSLQFLPAIMAGTEYALVSAYCNWKGISPYLFFGGEREEIETDITIGISDFENTIRKAKEYYDAGFRILKIKVGLDLEEDLRKVIEIKRILPDVDFIIDANQGYTPKIANYFINTLYREGIEVLVFEQPVHKDDHDGIKYVRYNSPFPVAVDESVYTVYDALRLIKEDAIDFINIKLMKSGIYDALGIIEIARASNKGLMIGCMGESSLGISQSVHFSLGTSAFTYHDLDSHLSIADEEFRGDFIQEGPIIRVRKG